MKYIWARAVAWVERSWVSAFIVAANFIGFVWGVIYWYGPHLRVAPLIHWPFIPDCPLFALLFIPAFLQARRGHGNNGYNLLTAFGLIKYGIWTNAFWYAYWAQGNPVDGMGVAMVLTHLGMILEGIYLMTYLKPRPVWVLVAWAWFFLSDYVDYGLGEYPRIPDLSLLPFLQWHTIAVTWILSLALGVWSWKARGHIVTLSSRHTLEESGG